MSNIFHQSVEDILRSATPEQKILWNNIFLRFGERIAVSQLFYCGTVAGSELNTYVAGKIFLFYQLDLSAIPYASSYSICSLFNENNMTFFSAGNFSGYWDTTAAAARTGNQHNQILNGYFSRITFNGYAKLIGYRITY